MNYRDATLKVLLLAGLFLSCKVEQTTTGKTHPQRKEPKESPLSRASEEEKLRKLTARNKENIRGMWMLDSICSPAPCFPASILGMDYLMDFDASDRLSLFVGINSNAVFNQYYVKADTIITHPVSNSKDLTRMEIQLLDLQRAIFMVNHNDTLVRMIFRKKP